MGDCGSNKGGLSPDGLLTKDSKLELASSEKTRPQGTCLTKYNITVDIY